MGETQSSARLVVAIQLLGDAEGRNPLLLEAGNEHDVPMSSSLRRLLSAVGEILARFWPMSRTEDQVLEDLGTLRAADSEDPTAP